MEEKEGNTTETTAANSNGTDTPTYFGDYEVLKSIGKGKFAVVYRAKKIGDDKIVALKKISVDMMKENAREKCLKEVRLLQSLDHPNIIRYMDSFITDNDLVIVYEWAAAGDLKRQLRKAQERGSGFEERVIWKYFSQICNAMQHMHERRIMHRDLKPANIFLTLDGTIKVGDLGLSRELSEHTIQAHSKVGTPLYMSPEVLKGDGYDFKSDIWSLGCLLYELAMLKSPFKSEGLNIYSLFQKISNGDYQPLPDHYSQELRDLTYAMISTKPEDRPEIQSVCEIAQKLRISSNESSKQKRNLNKMESKETNYLNEKKENEENNLIRTNSNKSNNKFNEDKNEDEEKENEKNNIEQAEEKSNNNPQLSKRPSSRTLGNEQKNEGLEETYEAKVYPNPEYQPERVNSGSRKNNKDNISISRQKSNNSFGGNNDGFNEGNSGKNNGSEYYVAYGGDKSFQGTKWNNNGNSDSSEGMTKKDGKNQVKIYDESQLNGKKDFNKISNVALVAVENENEIDQNKRKTGAVVNPQRRVRPSSGSGKRLTKTPSNKTNETFTPPETNNSKSQLGEKLQNSSIAFAVMEVLYGKLIVLDYPMQDPYLKEQKHVTSESRSRGRLLPIHFACDLHLFNQIAGHQAGYQFGQFGRMLDVFFWLSEKIGGTVASIAKEIDEEMDSPITMAKQVLRAMQNISKLPNMPPYPQEMGEVLPTALIPGHGTAVCYVLNYFADAALVGVGYTAKPFHWPDDAIMIQPDDQASDEEDEEIPDESFDPEAIPTQGKKIKSRGLIDEDDDEDSLIANSAGTGVLAVSMMIANIDPIQWKEETERVAPLLRVGQLGFNPNSKVSNGLYSGSYEWNQHIDLLKKYNSIQGIKNDEKVDKKMNGEENIRSKNKENSIKNNELLENLKVLQKFLSEQLQKIKNSENMINRTDIYSSMVGNYAGFEQKLTEYKERTENSNLAIEKLTNTFSELEEQHEELLEVLHQKTEGSDSNLGGNMMVKLKDAIKTIKGEIIQITMNISLVNHSLLSIRLKDANEIRVKQQLKLKNRKKRNTEDNDDELSSEVAF